MRHLMKKKTCITFSIWLSPEDLSYWYSIDVQPISFYSRKLGIVLFCAWIVSPTFPVPIVRIVRKKIRKLVKETFYNVKTFYTKICQNWIIWLWNYGNGCFEFTATVRFEISSYMKSWTHGTSCPHGIQYCYWYVFRYIIVLLVYLYIIVNRPLYVYKTIFSPVQEPFCSDKIFIWKINCRFTPSIYTR